MATIQTRDTGGELYQTSIPYTGRMIVVKASTDIAVQMLRPEKCPDRPSKRKGRNRNKYWLPQY